MKLQDLPTPCLILDRGILDRNLASMSHGLHRHGVAFRPHLKTAKSAEVARRAVSGEAGGIAVSTLAEAEYFAACGFRDITLAVGITPQKLERAAAIVEAGITLTLITDDPDTAAAIAAHPAPFRALIEIDSGEKRGGVAPESGALGVLARTLGARLAGVLTHGGHSYLGRTPSDMERIAEEERSAAVRSAWALRAAWIPCEVVSVGSTPTARHARKLDGVTEVRAGVYMFNDLFQAEIHSCRREDIALTVLTSVIGRRPGANQVLLDAGALALSKDRSTAGTAHDAGFGLVWDLEGKARFGECRIDSVYQEHGIATGSGPLPFDELRVGTKVRVAPNHACLTAAAYNRYYVVDGGQDVVEEWERMNGW
jgi:D-serine deaminase-like pyridoxal phosphate-dependent protein